jgi:hypothetical protein
MAKGGVAKKMSILEMASKAPSTRGGPLNWFDELKRAKNGSLSEILDLIDDWATGEREFTGSHTRASLARFLCSLDCCDRKENGMVELIRKVEIGEVKTATYR